MSKRKKIALLMGALLGAALLFACWLWPISLADQLPEETWQSIQVSQCRERSQIWAFSRDSEGWAALETALEQTRVKRRAGKFDGLDESDFQLWLYPQSGSRTVVYVRKNGSIAVAPEGDFDHYRYYDSGEELYRQLTNLLAK